MSDPSDVVANIRAIAEANREKGNQIAASCYDDAANHIERELVDDG